MKQSDRSPVTPSSSVLAIEMCSLILDAAIVGTRNSQVGPILGDGAAVYCDALLAKNIRDLIIGQRSSLVLLLNHFFDFAFENEQGNCGTGRPIHGFGEEVPQFENSLRRMSVLGSDGAADR